MKNRFYGKRSAEDLRAIEISKNGVLSYFAISILPEFPPIISAHLLNGFRSRRELLAYCAANGVALFRCYNT